MERRHDPLHVRANQFRRSRMHGFRLFRGFPHDELKNRKRKI
jgi:hypothetical protein